MVIIREARNGKVTFLPTRLENPSFLCASLLCKMLADRLLIFFFLRRGASRIVVASMKDPETSESSRNKPPSSAIRNLSLIQPSDQEVYINKPVPCEDYFLACTCCKLSNFSTRPL
jgi:hypothetical protein